MHDYRSDVAILRDRRFAFLFSARTLSMLGIAFAPVALAFGILDLPGATPTTLSLVLAAESVAVVVFTLAGGVIADRYPRHRVLQAAEWVNALAHVGLGLMILGEQAPTWALATAAAVSGTATAMVWPALTGIVPDVVPAAHLQQGNALLGLGGNVARVAGLVAGGVVVVAVGGGWALLIAAALFAAAGLLISLLALPRARAYEEVSGTILGDLRDGWQEFRSRQWLWVVVVQFSVLVMVWQAAHLVLGPVVAKQELGGPKAWTAVLTGEAIGLIVGVLIAMRIRPRRPILAVTLLSFGGGPALPPPRRQCAPVARRRERVRAGRVLRPLHRALADHHAAGDPARSALPGELLRRPGLADAGPSRSHPGRPGGRVLRSAPSADRLRGRDGAHDPLRPLLPRRPQPDRTTGRARGCGIARAPRGPGTGRATGAPGAPGTPAPPAAPGAVP